jgi:hypothetical protein
MAANDKGQSGPANDPDLSSHPVWLPMTGVPNLQSPPNYSDLMAPHVWPRVLCGDEGATGYLLKQVSESIWDDLAAVFHNLPAEDKWPGFFNPWELLGKEQSDDWRAFCEAGASQWQAWTHLIRIWTGAASLNRDPLAEAEKPDANLTQQDQNAIAHHWLGSTEGREFWPQMKTQMPWFADKLAAADEDWKRRQGKKGSTRPQPLPPLETALNRHDGMLVEQWLVFSAGPAPGFCWWSSQAVADYLSWRFKKAPGFLSDDNIRQIASRLGLRKAGITFVSEVRCTASHCDLLDGSGNCAGILTPDSVTAS